VAQCEDILGLSLLPAKIFEAYIVVNRSVNELQNANTSYSDVEKSSVAVINRSSYQRNPPQTEKLCS
jgi:hypothetical protein